MLKKIEGYLSYNNCLHCLTKEIIIEGNMHIRLMNGSSKVPKGYNINDG